MANDRRVKSVAYEWAKLEQAVDALRPAPMQQLFSAWVMLRPFIRWCIGQEKRPSDVGNHDIVPYIDFAETKRTHTVSKHRRAQKLRRCWNFAVEHVPGWPPTMLAIERSRNYANYGSIRGDRVISFDPSKYHPSLVAEVKLYCESGGFLRGGSIDRPGDIPHKEKMLSRLAHLKSALAGQAVIPYTGRRLRRLAPTTLYDHSRVIYRTATALHQAGEANLGDLASIANVVTPSAAAILADRICAEWHPGARPSSYAADSVRTLCAIAKRCGIDFSVAEIIVLRELVHELLRDVESTYDISAKNLRHLAQFDDERVFSMLIALPDVVFHELEDDRAKGGRITRRKARLAEIAVAIEILNTLPIRRSSLCALDLTRNLIAPWRRGAHGKLIVFTDQEKTEKRLEVRLSRRSWRLIALYCQHYRPILPAAKTSTFLFPARTAIRYRWPAQLADDITRLVRRRLKVHINVHLWRHIMGSRLYERSDRPEDGERLLGHTYGSAATKNYIRVSTSKAAERLGVLTDAVRGQGIRQLSYGKHRVRRRKAGGLAAQVSV